MTNFGMTRPVYRGLILVLGFAVLLLGGCGGGGGSDGGTASPPPDSGASSGTGDTTSPQPPAPAIDGHVIDGYVKGAKVFIDVNWSLSYDEGEPVATSAENGNFEFSDADLSDFPCYSERPIVAEVPQGAEDTDRGLVNAPFKLVYLPPGLAGDTDTQADVNITPFTTLLAAVVADAKDSADVQSIAVSDGCGSPAGEVAAEVSSQLDSIQKNILQPAGISLVTFYDDFVKNGNGQRAQAAAVLSDYFKATYQLASEFQKKFLASYDSPANINIFPDTSVIADILAGNTPEAIPLTVSIYGDAQTTDGAGWTATELLTANGVYLLGGQYLVDWQCGEGPTGACTYQPVELDSLLKTAKSYKDVVDWVRTDESTGYDLHLGNTFWLDWKDDLADYRCYLADRFIVENPDAMPYKDGDQSADGITEPQFLEGEYYGGQNQDPPIDCQYEDAPLVYVFRSEIFPRVTANGYWKSTVQYSFDVNALDTSRIKYLATTSLYSQRDTFDAEAGAKEIEDLPWSPSQITDMKAGLQPNEWFSVTVEGDNFLATYVSLTPKCTTYSKAADGSKTVISTVTGDDTAAQTLCFGDLTQWP